MMTARQPFNAPRLVLGPPEPGRIKTWGEALRHCRIKAGWSYHEVADHTGVKADVVRDWERGEAFPASVQIKRLYGLKMHALRAFASLLPGNTRAKVEAEEAMERPTGTPAPVAQTVAEAEAEITEELPPPKTFGEALRRARIAEWIGLQEVATLVGVHPSSPSHWELDRYYPIRDHYNKLLDLFPALRHGPLPMSRDLDKPGGKATGASAVPIDVSPRQIAAIQPATPPPPALVPPPVAAPARISAAEVAGLAYARALVAASERRAEHHAAVDRVRALEQAVREADAAVQAALAELQQAATGQKGTP